jgi:hypothetical protein
VPEWVQLIFVSAVTMGLAHTITREKVFEPLRKKLGGEETWLGYLVCCPYCVSHWIAFVLVPLTSLYYVTVPWDWWIADEVASWFLSSILVTVIAAFLRIVFFLIDEKQALVRKEKEIAKEIVEEDRADAEDRDSAHH